MSDTPATRYIKTADGIYLAYQVAGEGPVDVALDFHFNESNVDLMWDEPDWRPFMMGIAEFARLILHDRRGLGVSSRNVEPPNLETRAADLLTVLNAVDSDRPILAAGGWTGAMHALFAATHPERVFGLCWNNPKARAAWAPDYPWGDSRQEFAEGIGLSGLWGTTEYAGNIARSRMAERFGVPLAELPMQADLGNRNSYGKINRNTASPDVVREIARIEWDTDARAILPSVHAPVVLVTGTKDNVDETEYIASLMPNATMHMVEGRSGLAVEAYLETIRKMAGVPAPAPELDKVLSTVLFTDIINSTARQASLGDRGWRDLVLAHHGVVREALRRWRGRENDTAGDGFYATFDGPARAIRCALEICQAVRNLGIEIRAGIHTGECEIADGKCTGITVSIGDRVASRAGPSQVLVSRTVKDLVAGSGFSFDDTGEHALKGVPGEWRLYRVTS